VIIIADRVSHYPDELYEKGLEIITVSTLRNHPAALSPRVKSLNYLNNILAKTRDRVRGDAKVGVEIVQRAIQEPLRQIAENAGHEGSVVANHVLSNDEMAYGFNALTEEYEDLVKAGVIDPAKVVRSTLENAASIGALVLTTEALVAEIPQPEPMMPPGGGDPGMGGMGGMM